MKEVINIYKKHKVTVDGYINTLIKSLPKDYIDYADSILKSNNYIQLMYAVDENFKQISPVICRKNRDDSNIQSDKSHYFAKLDLDANNMYVSNPYIHYRTGQSSLSSVIFIDNKYYIFDINLIKLLENLNLIEYNSLHDKINKSIYGIGATILSLVSVALIVYGGYKFLSLLFVPNDMEFLEDIFKSIISITLGLAIYDFAKQIFEHEVLFTSFHHTEDKQYKVLGKFLISVVIALSIETLMVVFKIALEDYTQMLAAFYLIIGTTIMFVGLSYFYKTIRESGCDEEG
ncbi:MAG: hypothetical protein HF962_05320 [Sulfurovum sp.]|nr:hypothetical protein [Sulfurovum sp.]